MSNEPLPRDLKETYLLETLGEVILLNKELKELRDESMMRIGITQNIIDEQLTASREVLAQYTQAANAHFATKKEELRDIAEHELKKALLDTHKQLLISNPPKMGMSSILPCVLLSGAVSALVSITCVFLLLI
ncbi:hypothetical protein EM61_020170 [Vibrio parahaemolyticus]|uniref:hypothetical protein n=1 Tax=Vibrio parahaemolyticus TaxID=670 RepID=UPI00040D6469|nr:hypothetical protein [Vibrio parahaemolyticus]ELN6894073.1 hypothetical protein [Vibrio cholerae]EIK4811119.1 hypothetical protein [Vibrio parahaemolyticus]EKC5524130.1 hypothetical protein [Vibrio parahaemolyticus]KKC79460.1 hypothetical protein WR32_00175 [Vibrio parahaemolyticus]KKX76952.1 hypothetical protein UF35_08420 [Vibrio parahaemolyticus]